MFSSLSGFPYSKDFRRGPLLHVCDNSEGLLQWKENGLMSLLPNTCHGSTGGKLPVVHLRFVEMVPSLQEEDAPGVSEV